MSLLLGVNPWPESGRFHDILRLQKLARFTGPKQPATPGGTMARNAVLAGPNTVRAGGSGMSHPGKWRPGVFTSSAEG